MSAYLLLALLFLTGFLLARQKPLWNDEIYSQSAISSLSYRQLVFFQIPEGNICPLFYVLQKFLCDAVHYTMPDLWQTESQETTRDRYSEILLRLSPVFFMSLAMASIFYYFSRFYGWLAGIYSLFLCLSSYMVWEYYAEARPYALWIFLTTLQALFFLFIVREKKFSSSSWNALTLIHILLSLTIVFSVWQILAVTLLLWIWVDRDWKKCTGLMLVPVVIGLIYFVHSPHYPYWFDLNPGQMIRECFSRDRLYILLIYGFFLFLYGVQRKFSRLKIFADRSLVEAAPYFCLTVLMLAGAFLIMLKFKLQENFQQEGFPVSSRHFIFLTPVGIISTALFSIHLVKGLWKQKWILLPLAVYIGYLVATRFIKNIPYLEKVWEGFFF